MKRTLILSALVALALSGCGPDNASPQAATTTGSTAAAATSAPASPAGGRKVTPDQLCAMLSVSDASRISGFSLANALPSMSGDVAVCTYKDGANLGKMIIEYQPNAKTMFDMTKGKGEAVAGIGQEAVYFTTSGQLSVRLDAANLFHCYVLDLRMHNSDPKGGAIAVANLVVPQLPRA